MFTEAQNFAVVQTELDSVFFQNLKYDATDPTIATSRTGKLFKQITTQHAAYLYEVNKPVGLFPVIGETQTVPQGTPAVRNKVQVLIKDFAMSMPVSKDMFDDNLHGTWAENVRQFARKALITQDAYAFSKYNGAFTTTLTADGVSWINVAHPLIGGGTISNLIAGALSDSTLNDAMVALRVQKDQAGTILGCAPSALVVPPAKWKLAMEITNSALTSQTADNALNVWRSAFGFEVYTSPYLSLAAGGSDTAWFLLADEHSMTRIVRQGVETALTPWQYSTDRTYNYQANFREEVFVADYSGAVGSTG